MALAFFWAGLAELFRRRGVALLAVPLERTALLLPVLPMAAFWFMDARPPAVWLLISLFYGSLAGIRRAPWLAALSVAAANVGLWILWQRWHLGFLEHPQLWLIPPALAVLLAEHFGRQRLAAAEKGDSPHLCEAPSGPFRQMGTVPFSASTSRNNPIGGQTFK